MSKKGDVGFCPQCGSIKDYIEISNYKKCFSCKIGLFRHQPMIIIPNRAGEMIQTCCDARDPRYKQWNQGHQWGTCESEFRWLYENYLKDCPEYDNSLFEEHLQQNIKRDNRRKQEHFEDMVMPKPKCPTCGSTNITKISTSSKVISTAVLGLASDKMGKTFKCNSCGYTW